MTPILPAEQFTQAQLNNLFKKIVHFPLVRIIIAIAFLVPARFVSGLIKQIDILCPLQQSVGAIIGILLLTLLYSLYTKLIEKRSASEFSLKGMLPETVYGLGVGAGIMTLLVFILYVAGYYRIGSINSEFPVYINYIFHFTIAAFIEELIFRLILFRLIEEFLGTWISILFQIILFGFAHGNNPNATLWSSLAIGMEAGILLAAVFIYTRRMWFALALHMAWNYTQGVVFGIRVSGIEGRRSIIEPVIKGPDIITGGSFGLEASIISVVVCLFISWYFIQLSIIEKKIVLPSWKRKKIAA
jgi:membrane protease YdiL (CAAX protease family)